MNLTTCLAIYAVRTPRAKHCMIDIVFIDIVLRGFFYECSELGFYRLLLFLLVREIRLILIAVYARAYGLWCVCLVC